MVKKIDCTISPDLMRLMKSMYPDRSSWLSSVSIASIIIIRSTEISSGTLHPLGSFNTSAIGISLSSSEMNADIARAAGSPIVPASNSIIRSSPSTSLFLTITLALAKERGDAYCTPTFLGSKMYGLSCWSPSR